MLVNIKTTKSSYLLVTPRFSGGIAVFSIWADKKILQEKIIANLLNIRLQTEKLQLRELIYAKLLGNDKKVLDEVVVSKLSDENMLLMSHGSLVGCDEIIDFLEGQGFQKIEDKNILNKDLDNWLNYLLAKCITETQAAIVCASANLLRDNWQELLDNKIKYLKWQEKAQIAKHYLKIHKVSIIGLPNAGKSSLLNKLLNKDRAFVYHKEGATLDVVSEICEISGYAVKLQDLPGYNEQGTELEKEAWEKAKEKISETEVIILVVDASKDENEKICKLCEKIKNKGGTKNNEKCKILIFENKKDLGNKYIEKKYVKYFNNASYIEGSLKEDKGIVEKINRKITELLGENWNGEEINLPLPEKIE